MTRPIDSVTRVAKVNHTIVFNPMRPTVLKSPTFATPTNKREKTSGAIIILIRRRKMSLSKEILSTNGLMLTASG
jgi:hypothetical protein